MTNNKSNKELLANYLLTVASKNSFAVTFAVVSIPKARSLVTGRAIEINF